MTDIVDVEESVAITHVARPVDDRTKAQSLDSIYDHYQKKLYVIDRSGSMDSGMAPEDEIMMYKWTPEILDQFRAKMKAEFEAEMALEEDPSPDDELEDEKTLITEILANDLMFKFGIDVPVNYDYARTTERKIEAVRGAMRKFVEQRFKRFPDAQVGVFGFGDRVELMAYAGNDRELVLNAIDRLNADMGGTNIMKAVSQALRECKARPSRVGAHHIVLVTDAQDYGAAEVATLLPDMKQMNVVFDFILVLGQGSGFTPSDQEPVKTLKRVCQETGGEYNEVRKSTDFESKFLNVSNRKALPPKRD